jgi:protein gp37
MSKNTKIQWCDSTINPVMGCSGCELFPTPGVVVNSINAAAANMGVSLDSRRLLKSLIAEGHEGIASPGVGHREALTTTNIYHFRDRLGEAVTVLHGRAAGKAAVAAIKSQVTCYAAKLHLNRGASVINPERTPKKGYAPTFEQLTKFDGRMATAAGWSDLLGTPRPGSPWKDGLPRMIFISDMGDAMSSKGLFPFIKQEVTHLSTEKGRRHLWLWLTKRPHIMRDFAEEIGGLPGNVCAMTTVTGPDALHRVDELRQIQAACRGLSVEPLWERIPPQSLDLSGIDWLILGGESGGTRTFDLAWVAELRAHCQKNNTAFFLKQLGRNPVLDGKAMRLKDPHGGDWTEWPKHLRVREFPRHFHQYRLAERTQSRSGLARP